MTLGTLGAELIAAVVIAVVLIFCSRAADRAAVPRAPPLFDLLSGSHADARLFVPAAGLAGLNT